MIRLEEERTCCGCAACAKACPAACITMREGTLGAALPEVDEARCLECGLCERVCPMRQKSERGVFEPRAYAAYSRDEDVRFRGSSGGMFETLSRALLSEGYSVYGAAFDADLRLECTVATAPGELAPC